MHIPVLLGTENALFKAIGDIFHPLFIAIATALAWIYSVFGHTYAVAIIILTIVIMGLLTPLTIKSTRSMLAMQALQPEMQKLRAKYKGPENRQQLNEEMMKLYREQGVSPTGGCLPMFLQMPAFVVLYDVIRGLANTVKHGALMGTGHKVCHAATVCATPRYVPHSSAIYASLLKTPGVMHSIGLNLAAKPLTHRGNWVDYVPYFALVIAAVGLQYFQMAQMTRRNKKNNNAQQVPQQMQMMQRVMPLIFAYIYFLVPAGVAVYMVMSSAIRVLTQDLIFRYGLVEAPGARQVGGGKDGKERPKLAGLGGSVPAASSLAPEKRQGGASARAQGKAGSQPGAGRSGNAGDGAAAGSSGTASNGNTRGITRRGRREPPPPAPPPKAHPRSKAKRARRPR